MVMLYWSLMAKSLRHSSSGITAPVGLPGEHTYMSWVFCQMSAGTLSQSTAKLRSGTLGTK